MNNSSFTPEYSLDPKWDLVARDVLFLIIGVTGNICLIFITLRHKSLRTVPNYLIVNLAVVDLGYICLFLPAEISISLDLRSEKFEFFKSEELCELNRYLQLVFLGVSTFTLTALSVDRYLAVSKPLACRVLRSGRRRLCAVLLGIALIWSAAFAAGYPGIQLAILGDDGKCLFKRYRYPAEEYTYACIVIFLLVPSVIISVSYCCTAKNLLKSNHLLQGGQSTVVSPRQRRQRLRLAIAIVIIVVVFVTTWTLYYALDVVFFLNGGVHYLDDFLQPYPAVNVLNQISEVLVRINALINPIILFVVSSAHRRCLAMTFCCCLQSRSNGDRKRWMRLRKNTSMSMQTTMESQTRRSHPDNGQLISDNQV
ncbi:neuropeptide CCHamide-1 receptor-like [Acanthaster planci]|uniref:Neuropeptide CCHamide-1 receptor-like n=1 Tax=Acanthaster planci TaxID=133434 RepID=A0A8B7XFB3_ACAPL|nr:neuropeptide CCHamide-1 receptor-like [Acanthaster planci]XP_022079448.1 neuropeptide CCHamide-1 receptor-like [Acanthaster planci]XP_022079449.1 neuropeptide CCHamide-1 receptor-like [Acanthaster planci]